jgi:DNA replication and repair protein RecF
VEITQVHLRNFRCFDQKTIFFENKLVLIEGNNGSGKTSILEAIHYACYIRSFRTYYPLQLMRFEQDSFFIKIGFREQQESHTLHIGFAEKKRLVKLNQQSIVTYREIVDHYRVITITEEDLTIIKGSPEIRRRFLDSFLTLKNPDYLIILKKLKTVVDNRTSLLKKMVITKKIDQEAYIIWTDQLIQYSLMIQEYRKHALTDLVLSINRLLHQYIGAGLEVQINYEEKKQTDSLANIEKETGRTLFGAHLDDFSISLQHKPLRIFASRGQQKLVMLLMKIAQVEQLRIAKGDSILVIDDFMTDLDETRIRSLIQALCNTGAQIIFTSPLQDSFFKNELLLLGPQQIVLTC